MAGWLDVFHRSEGNRRIRKLSMFFFFDLYHVNIYKYMGNTHVEFISVLCWFWAIWVACLLQQRSDILQTPNQTKFLKSSWGCSWKGESGCSLPSTSLWYWTQDALGGGGGGIAQGLWNSRVFAGKLNHTSAGCLKYSKLHVAVWNRRFNSSKGFLGTE